MSQYGRLTIVGPGSSRRMVAVRCECGTAKEVRADHLRAGKVRSCGCLLREVVGARRRAARKLFVSPGDVFGRLTVIREEPGVGSEGRHGCVAQCQCGNVGTYIVRNLKIGKTKSCGCLRLELRASRSTTHGESANGRNGASPEYHSWRSIIARCEDASLPGFADYGGRGIRVCDEWRRSFESFLAHVGRRPSMGHSIDRIDNDGNYEPGNVRWATRTEQARNRRSNKMITIDGETMCVAAWCDRYGAPQKLARTRILQLGWDPVRALTEPAHPTGRGSR